LEQIGLRTIAPCDTLEEKTLEVTSEWEENPVKRRSGK
jgi:hypothetical protein